MINNTNKFERYREEVKRRMKSVFNPSSIQDFDFVFSDAYLDGFVKFEKYFDASHERLTRMGSLEEKELYYLSYICVKGQFLTLLEKEDNRLENETNYTLEGEEAYQDPQEFELENLDTLLVRLFHDMFNRKSGFDIKDNPEISLSKQHERIAPLMKMEVWTDESQITSARLKKLTDKLTPHLGTNRFELGQPTPIVRLLGWMSTRNS